MKVSPVVILVTLGGLALTACTPDYAKSGSSPVLLLITGVNGGNVLQSTVRLGTLICPDNVSIRVENHPKNPNITAIDYRGDLVIERYEVRYYRSDGRGVQGVDVPFTISGNLASEVIFNAASTVSVEVVRRQAKLEPPLSQLVSGGGAFIVTMFAEITLHARTTIGQAVSASGRLQIDFAEFASAAGTTTCPVPQTPTT
jgi:hypothetical protein